MKKLLTRSLAILSCTCGITSTLFSCAKSKPEPVVPKGLQSITLDQTEIHSLRGCSRELIVNVVTDIDDEITYEWSANSDNLSLIPNSNKCICNFDYEGTTTITVTVTQAEITLSATCTVTIDNNVVTITGDSNLEYKSEESYTYETQYDCFWSIEPANAGTFATSTATKQNTLTISNGFKGCATIKATYFEKDTIYATHDVEVASYSKFNPDYFPDGTAYIDDSDVDELVVPSAYYCYNQWIPITYTSGYKNMPNLTTLYLGKNIEYEQGVTVNIRRCEELTYVEVDKDNQQIMSDEKHQLIMSKDGTEICFGFGDNPTIPSTVKYIAAWAFMNDKKLYEITIPNNVLYIGGATFKASNVLDPEKGKGINIIQTTPKWTNININDPFEEVFFYDFSDKNPLEIANIMINDSLLDWYRSPFYFKNKSAEVSYTEDDYQCGLKNPEQYKITYSVDNDNVSIDKNGLLTWQKSQDLVGQEVHVTAMGYSQPNHLIPFKAEFSLKFVK